jgi:glucose-1-phosphate adenylyltransferase
MSGDPCLVILAGGVSSRMKSSAAEGLEPDLARDAGTRPKSMIRLGRGGRPFLDYLLFHAREAGYRDVLIVVGERDSSVREAYGAKERDNVFGGLLISYAVQPVPAGREKPLGTADALMHGLRARPDWRGRSVTVCNSDNLYSREVLRRLRELPSGCGMIDYQRDALGLPPERVARFAVTVKDDAGRLADIVEQPSPADLVRAAGQGGRVGVSMNIWRFPYDWILPCLEEVSVHPERKERELPGAVSLLLRRRPGCMDALPAAEHVPDLTDRTDIQRVRRYLERQYPGFSFGVRT